MTDYNPVRCDKCIYNYGNYYQTDFNPDDIVCTYWETDGLLHDDFCSYGKRKEADCNNGDYLRELNKRAGDSE